MRWPDGHDIGIGLCGDRCISEIPQHTLTTHPLDPHHPPILDTPLPTYLLDPNHPDPSLDLTTSWTPTTPLAEFCVQFWSLFHWQDYLVLSIPSIDKNLNCRLLSVARPQNQPLIAWPQNLSLEVPSKSWST